MPEDEDEEVVIGELDVELDGDEDGGDDDNEEDEDEVAMLVKGSKGAGKDDEGDGFCEDKCALAVIAEPEDALAGEGVVEKERE
jgi:hypothetical protein